MNFSHGKSNAYTALRIFLRASSLSPLVTAQAAGHEELICFKTSIYANVSAAHVTVVEKLRKDFPGGNWNMHFIFLAILPLLMSTGFSDDSLEKFKKSFVPELAQSEIVFEQASKLKPTEFKLGVLITDKECLELQNKIKSNYKIDPFSFQYGSGKGRIRSLFCSDHPARQNFVLKQSGVSNLGLAYNLVVQLTTTLQNSRDVTLFLIDDSYRIVEKQAQAWTDNTLVHKHIHSMDEKGDVYQINYERYPDEEYQTERFISSNGMIPMPWFRTKRVSLANPQDSTLEIRLSRMNSKTWDFYVLPITYSWSSGFYNYGGAYLQNSMIVVDDEYLASDDNPSIDLSELVLKYHNHSELCAYGGRSEGGKISQYPLDKNLFKECFWKE